MPTSKQKLSCSNRDEIRKAVALFCLAQVYNLGSMKVAVQQQKMFDLFHGKKGMLYIHFI